MRRRSFHWRPPASLALLLVLVRVSGEQPLEVVEDPGNADAEHSNCLAVEPCSVLLQHTAEQAIQTTELLLEDFTELGANTSLGAEVASMHHDEKGSSPGSHAEEHGAPNAADRAANSIHASAGATDAWNVLAKSAHPVGLAGNSRPGETTSQDSIAANATGVAEGVTAMAKATRFEKSSAGSAHVEGTPPSSDREAGSWLQLRVFAARVAALSNWAQGRALLLVVLLVLFVGFIIAAAFASISEPPKSDGYRRRSSNLAQTESLLVQGRGAASAAVGGDVAKKAPSAPMPVPTPTASPSPPSTTKLRGQPEMPGPYLCAELVLPAGNECGLFVPPLPASALRSSTGYTMGVNDTKGNVVFSVLFGRGEEGLLRLALMSGSADEKAVKAQFGVCREGERLQEQRNRLASLSIHSYRGTRFGDLRAASDDSEGSSIYMIQTDAGERMHIHNSNVQCRGSVTNDNGLVMAIIRPGATERLGGGLATGGPRQVVVGPLVDAGLIVLALLGTDWLYYEALNA